RCAPAAAAHPFDVRSLVGHAWSGEPGQGEASMRSTEVIRTAGRAALAAVLLGLITVHASGAQTGAPAQPPINPVTGQAPGAPTGCCCFPKADSPAGTRVCRPNQTEFDCKAQCAELRDGKERSGCTWDKGACPKD